MTRRRQDGDQSATWRPIRPADADGSGRGDPTIRPVWWGYALGLVAAAALGAAAATLRGFRRPRRQEPVGKVSLARPTLAALRAGVPVLDAADPPVLANPPPREMGLLRPRPADG